MSRIILTTLLIFSFGCSEKDEDTGDTGSSVDTAEENLTGDE